MRSPSGTGLRIAYLVNQYPAITHTFIRREIRELERHGVQVGRFSLRVARERVVDPEDLREQNVTTVVLEAGFVALARATALAALAPGAFAKALGATLRLARVSDRGILRHLAYLAEAALLAKWLREQKYDHVHAHFGTNPATVALLCNILGGPRYSFTAHGLDAFSSPAALAIREKVRRCAFAVAVSQDGLDSLAEISGPMLRSKLRLIPCGLPEGYWASPVQPVPSVHRLSFVGRLDPEKDPLALVRAVSDVVEEFPALRLVMVGDGPLRKQVLDLVGALRLSSNIELVGWCAGSTVRDQIRASRALVLSSRFEGLPTVLLECYALGRPAVATNVGGVAELVHNGETGWLVDAGSRNSLATGIRRVLEATPRELAKLGHAGRELVKRRHSGSASALLLKEAFADAALFHQAS